MDAVQTIELLKAAKPLFDGDEITAAAVGAITAVVGVWLGHLFNLKLASNQRDALRKSTAFQIYAEVKATLEIEAHRGYSAGLEQVVVDFDAGQLTESTYEVQVPDDRFPIYKANLPNLGLLQPQLQSRVVLFYQLLEAIIQDIKPGGFLNARPVRRDAFAEVVIIIGRAKGVASEILAGIEQVYPDVAGSPKRSTCAFFLHRARCALLRFGALPTQR